ncbi:predicted protein [Naegleria gruberi]|uniref:Predicted protein n=1 Tax=Naegleria gruberi TaxID=5762 RepID=D2W0X1_NAEGR|nr:uncharacterized protein NAEGRDRAFT_75009 [Naegleria gruberi]EFC37217.1 predicted protein [Naegleria gruberi]|eukprot:XP_002669961.1 predicted protein [Naegleria gruberi strain NEG-M]
MKPLSYKISTIAGQGLISEQDNLKASFGFASMIFMNRNEKGEQVEDILLVDDINLAVRRLTFRKNDQNEFIPSTVKVLAGGIPMEPSLAYMKPKLLTISEGGDDDENGRGEIYVFEERNGGMIKKIDRKGDLQLIAKSSSDSFVCEEVSLDKANWVSISDMKYSREGMEEVLYLVDSKKIILRASLTRRTIKAITKCVKDITNAIIDSADPSDFIEINSIFVRKNSENKVILYVADSNSLKKIEQDGNVSKIAGNGKDYLTDADVSTNALNTTVYPTKIFVNSGGEILFTEMKFNKIRKLDIHGNVVSIQRNPFVLSKGVLQSPLTNNIYFEEHNIIYKMTDKGNEPMFGNGTINSLNGVHAMQARINPISVQVSSKSGKDIITVLDSEEYFKSRVIDENQIIQTVIGGGIYNLLDIEGIDALSVQFVKNVKNSFRSNNGDQYIVLSSELFKINDEGKLVRVIGSGSKFAGDGHSALSAILNEPSGVFYSKTLGKTFIADSKNDRVRVISKEGVISTIIGKLEGTVDNPRDVMERNGYLYYAERSIICKIDLVSNELEVMVGNRQTSFNGDGKKGNETSIGPESIYVTEEGDIYFADISNHRIRKWTRKTDLVSTIAGTGVQGSSEDGILATNSTIDSPSGVYLNRKGEVYFVESESHKIRKITSEGKLLTLFQVRSPHRLIVTSNDEVIVSHDAFITKYSNGEVTAVAGSRMKSYPELDDDPFETYFGSIGGLSFGETESDLLFANPKFDLIRKISNGSLSNVAGSHGDGLNALEARFMDISSVVVSPDNELFIADSMDHTIRKVSSDGIVSTIAGVSQIHGYNLYDPQESILNGPTSLSSAKNGDLFFIDQKNYVIRKISNGIVTTIIGTPNERCDMEEGKRGRETCLSMPQSLAVSPGGDALVFSDLSTIGIFHYNLNDENAVIRRIAGFENVIGYNGDGEATTTLISHVPSLAFSNDGLSVYFVDSSNNLIRKLSPYCPEDYELSEKLQQCTEKVIPHPNESPKKPKPHFSMFIPGNSNMSGMISENLMALLLVTIGSVLILSIILAGAIYYLLKNRESQKHYQKVERDEIPEDVDDNDIGKFSLGADLEEEEEETEDIEMI